VNPVGLLARSVQIGEPFIFVAINHRLGLFGFLSGPDVPVHNLGILDQRLALEWVQQHIHLFGGDPNRVTLMGESSGGGSIIYHIAAGEKNEAKNRLFHQAILQSPATNEPFTQEIGDKIYDGVLAAASKVTNTTIGNFTALKVIPFQELFEINALVVAKSNYGSFTFMPIPDGGYVANFSGPLLSSPVYLPADLNVMVAHNLDEGLFFTDPTISNSTQYLATLEDIIPTAPTSVIAYAAASLYPPVFNNSLYSSEFNRAALTTSDIEVTCNTRYLAAAFGSNAYSYLFAVGLGYHGQDVSYTFYVPGVSPTTGLTAVDPAVATLMQDYIISFVTHGEPGRGVGGLPAFPAYGGNASVLVLAQNGTKIVVDPMANARCGYWQTAPWL
jgi:carboxylesterase type B